MVKSYKMKQGKEKLIERVIQDEYLNYNHVILCAQDALPEHYSNAQVYICILRGQLTLSLDDAEAVCYEEGHILHIAPSVKMNVSNKHQELVEFTIVKVPPPQQ